MNRIFATLQLALLGSSMALAGEPLAVLPIPSPQAKNIYASIGLSNAWSATQVFPGVGFTGASGGKCVRTDPGTKLLVEAAADCGTGGGGGSVTFAGDLSGTTSSQTVVGLQNRPLGSAAPNLNDVVTWNGSQWAPAPNPVFASGGDTSGPSGNQTVIGIQGRPVSSTAPTSSNQVLNWSGTSWQPAQLGFGNLSGTATTGQLPFTYSGNTTELGTVSGTLTSGRCLQADANSNIVQASAACQSGTVTSFSSGALSPLFTTSVATATSTPALSFSLSTAGAHTVLGNFTGSTAAPTYSTLTALELPFTYTGNTTQLATTTGTFTNGHCVSIDANFNFVDSGQVGCGGGGAGGTVTQVGLVLPPTFTVTGSPVNVSGDLTGTWNVAGADYLLTSTGSNTAAFEQINSGASCGDGSHATGYDATAHKFTCQALTISGTPGGTNTAVQFNNSSTFGGDATNFFYNSGTHNLTATGAVAGGTLTVGTGANTTSIQNASLTATRTLTLPDANSNPVRPSSAAANQFANGIASTGVISYAQPSFGNLSGAATITQLPNGTANQFLSTNTSGTAIEQRSFAIDNGGTDYSVTYAAGLATFHLPTVSGTTRGAVTSALFNTWNGKGAPVTCGANTFVTVIASVTDSCAAAVSASTAPSNQFATAISAAGALTYAQPSFTNISGTATVPQGGTGATSLTANALIKGNGTSALTVSLAVDNGVTMAYSGTGGISAASYTGTGSGPAVVRMPAGTFAVLNAAFPCSPGTEGSLAAVSDSTTATYGATITGGGSNHILAFCNGTAWTVH